MRGSRKLGLGGANASVWEKYNSVDTTYYYWDAYDLITTRRWDKFNAVSAGLDFKQPHDVFNWTPKTVEWYDSGVNPAGYKVTFNEGTFGYGGVNTLYDNSIVPYNIYKDYKIEYDTGYVEPEKHVKLTLLDRDTTIGGTSANWNYDSIGSSSPRYVFYQTGYGTSNNIISFGRLIRASYWTNGTNSSSGFIFMPFLSTNPYEVSMYDSASSTWTYTQYLSERFIENYSKGTTSYGTVTSTSASAYPTDGRHTDGYWYTYKSGADTYSKGNYRTEFFSTSSSAYPNNGYNSNHNYWFVYSRNVVNHAKGGTLYGQVKNNDPNAYPDNGWQDGYWWVKIK